MAVIRLVLHHCWAKIRDTVRWLWATAMIRTLLGHLCGNQKHCWTTAWTLLGHLCGDQEHCWANVGIRDTAGPILW
ncbi:unnamed protein product [Staurois parvus]|uniref:Secreted protein n=1 Tax=Staurois parvus TaxID=386267 RepID=A0ABN9GX50_9NEOB|nr:unnamed protein product [Staurois parvus]